MMKILILDDLQAYVAALRACLIPEFEIVSAGSLEEVRQVDLSRVSVALLDVRLSETDPANRDGIVFLREVRATRPTLPVLIMSAYRDFDTVEDVLDAGADYFLRKPINVEQLKGLLRGFVAAGRRPSLTLELRKSFGVGGPKP